MTKRAINAKMWARMFEMEGKKKEKKNECRNPEIGMSLMFQGPEKSQM